MGERERERDMWEWSIVAIGEREAWLGREVGLGEERERGWVVRSLWRDK